MKIDWIQILAAGSIIGFLVAFIMSLIVKWRIHQRLYVQTGFNLCMFCTGFWTSLGLTIVLMAAYNLRLEYFFMIPISTMIAVHVKLPGLW
jgi:uncharacterized membrane protein